MREGGNKEENMIERLRSIAGVSAQTRYFFETIPGTGHHRMASNLDWASECQGERCGGKEGGRVVLD